MSSTSRTTSSFPSGLLAGATLCLLLIAGCDSLSPDAALDGMYAADTRGVAQHSPSADVIEGHYIVMLSRTPAVKDGRADAALEALTSAVSRKAGASVNHVYRHVLTGFAAELTLDQVEDLRNDPRVLSVEPDAYGYGTSGYHQAYSPWGLDRIDQREGPLDRVYAYSGVGSGVTAYVIDSGIHFAHSEFGGRALLGYDFDPDSSPGGDCNGHGTHVAGTLGGESFGVAKGVNLVSVRVLGCDGRTPWSRLLDSVDWVTEDAITNGRLPAVANVSIGGAAGSHTVAMEEAIRNSVEAGVHYVISAGNANGDACTHSPARIAEALTAGASDIQDSKAFFSNYGSCVDLYAPGHAITSAHNTDAFSQDGSYTRTASGTSMAAPHIAGVVALYLEANPDASPNQVFSAIIDNTTRNAISGVPSGVNRLLHSLWQPVSVTPPPAPELTLAGTGLKVRGKHVIDLTWNATGAPMVSIVRDGAVVFTAANSGSYRDETGNGGNSGTYVHQVCEVGYDNCSNQVTTIFGDGAETNQPPAADFTFSVDGLNVQFTDTSTDSDGSVVSWSWSFGDGATSSTRHPARTYATGGTYSVSLTVTDDSGATSTVSKNVTVGAVEPPPPGDFVLSATGYKERGRIIIDLTWSGATSAAVDVHRNGQMIAAGVANSGSYTDHTGQNGGGTFTHKVCEVGTEVCSNVTSTSF